MQAYDAQLARTTLEPADQNECPILAQTGRLLLQFLQRETRDTSRQDNKMEKRGSSRRASLRPVCGGMWS